MPTPKNIGPIVALVMLLVAAAFGVYALRGAFRAVSGVTRAPVPGVTVSGEQGGEVFEPVWSAVIGPIQDLALMRQDSGSPLQVLALAVDRNEISRFDPQGRLLNRIDAPTGAFRLTADARGRLGFLLVASIESHWSWKDLRRVTTANHLSAIDPQGRTLWTYTRSAGSVSADRTSPFDVALLDGENDRAVVIMVDVGTRIVGLDTSGREVWSMPDEFRNWTQIDWQGTGRPDVLVMQSAGRDVQIAALDAARRLTPLVSLAGQSPLNGWYLARMSNLSAPTVATLTMSSTLDSSGKAPELFNVYAMAGEQIGRAKLPWPTRPIVTRPLSTIDTDGDGTRAWIAAGDDGVLYLFSPDAASQEVQHTGQYIRRLTVMSMSAPGDWLLLGTERGLQVLRRRMNSVSGVD